MTPTPEPRTSTARPFAELRAVVADLRRHADDGNTGGTHYDGCSEFHWRCAALAVVRLLPPVFTALDKAEAALEAREAENERFREAWRERDNAVSLCQSEIMRLREALSDARVLVEDWAAYASDYFQQKHDLAGDLARLDAALGKHDPAALRSQEGKGAHFGNHETAAPIPEEGSHG